MAPEILCIVEPLIEFRDIRGNAYVKGFGGDISNCCIAASHAGANAGIFTLLGDDEFGDDFCELWRKEVVNHDEAIRPSESETGIDFIRYQRDGHVFFNRRKHSAASAMARQHVGKAGIDDAKLLHVSRISQAVPKCASVAVTEAVAIAKSRDVLMSYYLNYRSRLCAVDSMPSRQAVEAMLTQPVPTPG